MTPDDIAKVETQKFYNWVTESALQKLLLELQFAETEVPEDEQVKLRAAIALGVTETLIKLKQLVAIELGVKFEDD